MRRLPALVRRLPLVLVLIAGAWLWKGGTGCFPTARRIVWQLPPDRATIRALDIQINDAQGALLKREQLFFEDGGTVDALGKAHLAPGEYTVRAFIERSDRPEEQVTRALRVTDAESYAVSFGP